MPLVNYGVLKGFAMDRRIGAGSGHYRIRVITNSEHFRVQVNSRSYGDSILRYAAIQDFSHPITDLLDELPLGFTSLSRRPGSPALDYVRGNLANEDDMVTVPPGLLGAHTRMNEVLDQMILTAMSEEDSVIFVFGQRWGPEQRMDRWFGYQPGNGIQDVHRNQGSTGRFIPDDGVFQDGGLIMYRPDQQRWQALFLAFDGQSWRTDDQTGHGFQLPPRPRTVRIASALVNAKRKRDGKQVVTLANGTDARIDLNGWALANSLKNKYIIEGMFIEPHSTVSIPLPGDRCRLSQPGDLITLLAVDGAKIDGVSYTRAQTSVAGVELIWPERQTAARDSAIPEAHTERVFVSYSRKNSDFAMGLAQELKDRGFPVWIDQWSIPTGAAWDQSIDSGIRESTFFIVVISEDSIKSKMVLSELQLAFDENKQLLPVLIQECELPRILRRVQYVDFRQNGGDKDEALRQLIGSMQQARDTNTTKGPPTDIP